MISSDKGLLWGGIAIALWVLYQAATGRFTYKRRGFRREDNPPAFWTGLTFEALLAVACFSCGLNFIALTAATGCLLLLLTVGIVVMAVRQARKLRR